MIHRAFRYRLAPTETQETTLRQFAGVSGIYCIRCTNGRRYVGSAVDLFKRIKLHASHLKCGRHHSAKLQNAWTKHGAEAFTAEIIEIVADKTALAAREQFWIDSLAAFGPNGFNMLPAAYSPVGRKHSAETKAKIAASHLGRPQSDEHRRNNAAARKGKRPSPESIAKGAAKRRGMKRSPEAIAKAAAANRGQKRSAEAKARMSAWQKGKPPTERQLAALARNAEARRGRKLTEDTKAKIRAARIGWQPSEETLARMSEGQRRRQARARAPVEAGTCLEAA